MVLRYCLGMMRSVSTLIIFSGAATPSSTVNFSMLVSCGFLARTAFNANARPAEGCRFARAPGPSVPGYASAGRSRHVRRARRDVLVGKAEMMADLVEQHVGDDFSECLVVLGPIIEDRPPVEPDQIGHLHRRGLGPERQPDAVEQPQEIELAFQSHLRDDVVGREILDPDDENAAKLPAPLRYAAGIRGRDRLHPVEAGGSW